MTIAQGAVFVREGRRHAIFCLGAFKTEVPRYSEIVEELARKICKDLGVPVVM